MARKNYTNFAKLTKLVHDNVSEISKKIFSGMMLVHLFKKVHCYTARIFLPDKKLAFKTCEIEWGKTLKILPQIKLKPGASTTLPWAS